MAELNQNESRPTKIAVIGELDSVIGFMAVGFDVRDCTSPDEARAQLASCAADCAVIYIDERFAEQISDDIDRYSSSPFPAIIPLPTGSTGTGWSSARLRRLVEKAVGSDIN